MLYIKCGVADENGKMLIPTIYDSIKILFNNYVKVRKNGKVGLYNNRCKLIIDVLYDDIYVFENKIKVKKNGKIGLFDLTGKQLIPCFFDKIIEKDKYFLVYLKNKEGIYYKESDIIIINSNFKYQDYYFY